MDERARRLKSLLEGFYGTGGPAGPDGGPAEALTNADKNDVNAKGFDADHYVASMIRMTKIDELLHQHVTWAAEIKNLDGDMQMLVYENYSKFISATDTIKKMKDNLGGMESRMERLLQNVTSIQEKSDTVNASLCTRRERIEQLNGTRSLLRKAQYIFDLPKRLRRFAASQSYRAAVQSYQGALPILEAYGESSFKSVREEADAVMADIVQQLQSQVMSDSFSFEQRSQAATLLQQLKQPVEELMDKYLETHWDRLLRQLKEAAEAATRAKAATDSAEGAVQQSLVDTLNRDFVEDFERTARSFEGIFPMGDAKLTASTRDLFNEYVAHVQQAMQGGEESTAKTSDLMFALRNLARDVGKMAEQVPGASLSQRAAESMQAAVREHIVQSFTAQERLIKDALDGLVRPLKAASSAAPASGSVAASLRSGSGGSVAERVHAAALETAVAAVADGTIALLQDLSNLLDPELDLLLPFHDEVVEMVHAELAVSFQGLLLLFSSFASAPSTPPTLVLVLSRLAQVLEHTAIAKLSATVDALFPFPNARLDDTEGGSAFSSQHFITLFHAASEKLLHQLPLLSWQYVEIEGKKLCVMIGKSITTPNWLKYKEPKDVRMVVDIILQEVEGIRQASSQLLDAGQGDARSNKGQSGKGGAGGGRAGAARAQQRARTMVLERDVAKLFKQKVEIFTRLEFSQSSVMSTLIRMLLKGFQECVRLQTFSRNGYQQIQVDALFLCESLRTFIDDEAVVDMLMDEVCTAAAERSLDPTPMDAAAVDRILQSKRERRTF